ncbi:hypothetical protein MATL_G00101780 [Megalops atlanticus]|uniref:Uncharacterized protein n=1 Tax=Megalops atlanticus TaxID=7932 RepID=A0A9D3T582_MEGAT|nr:hypothetical protein MATL_G00101780 [Megalops atlanticus]
MTPSGTLACRQNLRLVSAAQRARVRPVKHYRRPPERRQIQTGQQLQLHKTTLYDFRFEDAATSAPRSKREKGFKMYVSSYIDNFEDCP